MEKKTFIVEYKAKEGLTLFVPSPFYNGTFNTEIKGKDENEAEKFFERFYPNAQIVSIIEK